MKILAFTGPMGSGKSTAIKMLRELYPDDEVRLVKFAGPLYDIQTYIYKYIGREPPIALNGEHKDRKLLQWLGSDWGREIDVNLWVKMWARNVLNENERTIIVVDDCRYDNEAQAVKDLGGIIVKMDTPEEVRSERINLNMQNTSHVSERGVSDRFIKTRITNGQNDLLQLRASVQDAVQEYLSA